MINDPRISVTCDVCGEEFDGFSMTPLAGGAWDTRGLISQLRRDGWTGDKTEHICPNCAEGL